MNKLINLILTAALWRNYKFMIISVVVLIVGVFVVGLIHDDYLQWAQYQLSQGDGSVPVSVGWSFIIKYAVYIAGITLCFYANKWVNNKKALEKAQAGEDNSVLKSILSFKTKTSSTAPKSKPTAAPKSKPAAASKTQSNDAFANIRAKKSLRTQADILIDKKHKQPAHK
jgi:hypothetical protein